MWVWAQEHLIWSHLLCVYGSFSGHSVFCAVKCQDLYLFYHFSCKGSCWDFRKSNFPTYLICPILELLPPILTQYITSLHHCTTLHLCQNISAKKWSQRLFPWHRGTDPLVFQKHDFERISVPLIAVPRSGPRNLRVYDPTTSTLSVTWEHAEGPVLQYRIGYAPTTGDPIEEFVRGVEFYSSDYEGHNHAKCHAAVYVNIRYL